jgi:hypothetical protein
MHNALSTVEDELHQREWGELPRDSGHEVREYTLLRE